MRALLRLQAIQKAFSTVKKYRFQHSTKMIPHPEKVHKGGEDAVFAHDNILVVADGVGGWADAGVDPAIYSKKMCQIIQELYRSVHQEKYIRQPQLLISEAMKRNKETGSTTICILTLDPTTGILKSAYLGDSVYSIYRKTSNNAYEQHFQAPEHQRSFNFPYQIGSIGDDPKIAQKYETQALSQDLIVIGSDGLWDNLHNRDLFNMVRSNVSLDTMVDQITQTTFKNSLSRNFKSPFHEKAVKAGLFYPPMGKSDDISVIVAKVVGDI